MLASRCRCAFAGFVLSLSLFVSSAQNVVAQSAKSAAAGQNCGCSKNNASLVQPGIKAHQPFTAATAKHHHDPKKHQASHATGLNPGQTTPWMMSNQPIIACYAVPVQMTPMSAQQAYAVAQANQQGYNPNFAANGQTPQMAQQAYAMALANQQGFNPNYAANGQMPMMAQPVYIMVQPMQPGVNQAMANPYNLPPAQQLANPYNLPPAQPRANPYNLPVAQPGLNQNPNYAGQLTQPLTAQQPFQSGMPGYAVPNQNLTNNTRFQPSPTSTAWMLTPTANGNLPGSQMQTCNCNKHSGMTPGQPVAYQNPTFGPPAAPNQPTHATATAQHAAAAHHANAAQHATAAQHANAAHNAAAAQHVAAGQHACPPQQMQNQAAHAKKK